MEFTYEGLVRYGFGFDNPNHTAALICTLLPFVWLLFFSKPLLAKIFGTLLSIVLLLALAFTYSRAGVVVLFVEVGLFVFYFGRNYWKIFATLAGVFIIAILIANGLGRLTFESAMANRLDIWKAGFALYSSNPFGVDLGNSGEIVSAYILPEGIDCRTLINSHLTLLCEMGIFIGFLWILCITYPLLKNCKLKEISKIKFAALVAFFGMMISASLSTVFDWEVLFCPTKFPDSSTLNIAFEWLNLILFIGLLVFLSVGKFSYKTFLNSCGISLAIIAIVFVFGKFCGNAPYIKTIEGDTYATECKEPPRSVVLFDDEYNLKSALQFLRKHNLDEKHFISLRSWQHKEKLPKINPHRFVLFGTTADFIFENKAPRANVLIKPSPYFTPQYKNVVLVYLPKWDENYIKARKRYEELGITVKDF